MDLNELLARHQTSLIRAGAAKCLASRVAHHGLATGYASRIEGLRRASGAEGLALAVGR